MKERDVNCLAKCIRAHALRMNHLAHTSHVGGCLSVADILAVLYGRILQYDPKNLTWEKRDRLVVSKGHCAAAVYAVLGECGFFSVDLLDTYCQDGSQLLGHVSHKTVPGVEVSTGSLGHGLPIAAGMALAAKKDNKKHRVFVVLSDGELDEGSTWEAVLFAGHHKLDNLVAIVDYNKHQAMGSTREILDLDPLGDKWTAFKWQVKRVDGHDVTALEKSLARISAADNCPICIIADTIKGKGVSHMEDDVLWHYRYPRQKDIDAASEELGCEV